MPIKGNRKNLPQKQYLFADSDFDYYNSAKSPNPFQKSFGTQRSPTFSKYEGTDTSSKKFDMYDAKLIVSTSQNRSKERTSKSKSKDPKESELTKKSSKKLNLNEDQHQALMELFQAEKTSKSNSNISKAQKQI